MGIVLHRVVLVRIHLSGVMYSGEKYSWSDKKINVACFPPGIQTVCECGGEGGERNDTRCKSVFDGDF